MCLTLDETMTIIKSQRSRLTFDFFQPMWLKLDSNQYIKHIFLRNSRPIKIISYEDSLGWRMKFYTNGSGYKTKMAAMRIYGKKPFKIFTRTRRPVTLGLGYVVSGMWGLQSLFK